MIKRFDDMPDSIREHMRGGAGSVQVKDLLGKDDMVAHCRLFSMLTIEQGCAIGEHDHCNETEYYWILSGEGIVTEADGDKIVRKGDLVITGGGASHAIRNEKPEPLVFMALIVLD